MRTTSILLATGLQAAALCAQGDFAFDKNTPATLGSTLKLSYVGAPKTRAMMFMLSGNGGPTPLRALFGGTDTRSLQVGTDLLPLWLLISSSATGSSAFNFGVPKDNTLRGIELHLQLMTAALGGPNIVGKISNSIVLVPGASRTTDLLKTKLGDGRAPAGPGRALMAVFPVNGGVMLAGGGIGNILGANGLKTTEILDARTLRVRPGPDLAAPRALNTATVLKDGRVLIVGGVDSTGNPLATCEIYNPKTNKFTPTGKMTIARAAHGAALLADGRVLVVAGTKKLADVAKLITGILRSCEIYNPTSGTWKTTASIRQAVIGPALTTLKNGRVLVSGGARIETIFGLPTRVSSTTNSELFNPAGNGSWSRTGSLRQHRAIHNTILLADGRVLNTGGVVVSIGLLPPPTTFAGAQATNKSEIYDPTAGSWKSLPAMVSARTGHTATQMPNGRVLVVGGAKGAIDQAISVDTIQEFNPATNSFVATFKLKGSRTTHGAALLSDGTLMVFGGTGSSAATTTIRTIEIVHQ